MELSLSAQAVQAVYSLLSGALLGFGYDLVRALRRSAARKSTRAALDALYCIAAGFSLFVFALGPGDGRPEVVYALLPGRRIGCLSAHAVSPDLSVFI